MSVTPTGRSCWPIDRGSSSTFGQRYGTASRRHFHDALQTGDPLADAVVAVRGERGAKVRTQLADGLAFGLDTIDEPDPVIANLLQATESAATHVDPSLIVRGPRAWYDVPFRLHVLAMTAGALIDVYGSPSIASVLTATGRLNVSTEQRLRDTARWLASTMLPGSLAIGETGYVATVELRLIHAHARHAARRRGHDDSRHGVAINQVDLARTWLAFTLTGLRAEAALGYAASEAAVVEHYGYWQQVAHLLGIDPALVGGVRGHADAERLEAQILSISGQPDGASIALTSRTLETVARALDDVSRLPPSTSRSVLDALVRRLHGSTRAASLGVAKRPVVDTLMTPVIALVRAHRSLMRDDAAHWNAAAIGRYADALHAALGPRSTTLQVDISADVPADVSADVFADLCLATAVTSSAALSTASSPASSPASSTASSAASSAAWPVDGIVEASVEAGAEASAEARVKGMAEAMVGELADQAAVRQVVSAIVDIAGATAPLALPPLPEPPVEPPVEPSVQPPVERPAAPPAEAPAQPAARPAEGSAVTAAA